MPRPSPIPLSQCAHLEIRHLQYGTLAAARGAPCRAPAAATAAIGSVMCWMRSAAALDIVAQTVVAQTDDDRTVVGVRDSLDLPMASLAHAWRWVHADKRRRRRRLTTGPMVRKFARGLWWQLWKDRSVERPFCHWAGREEGRVGSRNTMSTRTGRFHRKWPHPAPERALCELPVVVVGLSQWSDESLTC